MRHRRRAYIQSSRKTNGTGKVAHLRMIKDKIREDDQVEGCMRVSRVCGSDIWRQRSEERLDGLSPHVPKHARGAAAPRLDVLRVRVQVLRDVERQIVNERLVRVIREDDLHTIYIQTTLSAGRACFGSVRTHLSRAALCGDETWQAAARAQLEHRPPCVKLGVTLEKTGQRARRIPSIVEKKSFLRVRKTGGVKKNRSAARHG